MKKLALILFLGIFLYACTNQQAEDLANIKTIEKELFDSVSVNPDVAKAQKLVDAYLKYSKDYPADTNCAGYLMKAAEISNNINKSQESIKIIDDLLTKYKDNQIAPIAMLYKATIFEEKLSDTASARIAYQQVIDNYPNTKLAEDAKACIDNLGKSLEEIIRSFEEKLKNDSLANVKN